MNRTSYRDFKKNWTNRLNDVLYLAFPELCRLCGTPLTRDEKWICHRCLYQMPKTDLSDFSQNQAALRFYGKISFEKAAAGFHYVKESPVQEVLELIKYKGLKELGQYLGSYLAGKLDNAHFFDDMDELVPVPLHRQKMKQRGYNQSEWIAKGISALTQLPVNTENLIRTSHNPSQTKKQVYERWENVASLFTLKQPAMFENKHLLLIDDVLTTGATLEACAHAIQEASGARVSFFALALA